MFKRILIANRGEIARRIQRTCERLGVETVAIYSDADAGAGFVQHATRAARVGPAPVTESYLNVTAILAAAREHGAEAVHPGYGFLSENAAFARAVEAAGLTFIGPAAETIALMGSKTDAKRAMAQAGVAGVPGYHGDAQDNDTLLAEADKIGFPVLIKASAGGGGKGMRVANARGGFVDACDAARREAANAFGDDRLLLEKFIERPRHVEVQVFGDHHGNVVHLFERECSVQRRYQKIIEEAPSPSIDDALRARMTQTAVTAAQAVNYRGAGTIEFIVTPDDQFYFMEMNTRLQVEHPVTEEVTGVDLVEWQLRAASGEPLSQWLPNGQDDLACRGHAIECRLYAEDPFNGFVPSSGTLRTLLTPDAGHVRLDIDLAEGQQVTPFYDPMIAKLTVHADTRDAAVTRMTDALNDTTIVGPATNVAFLRMLMQHPDYLACAIHTAYLDQQLADVLATFAPAPFGALAASAVHQAAAATTPASPWAADGWQANAFGAHRTRWRDVSGVQSDVTLVRSGATWAVASEQHTATATVLGAHRIGLKVATDSGQNHETWSVHSTSDGVRARRGALAFELAEQPLYPVVRDAATDDRRPGAPMPGRIVKVLVAPGDAVTKGQALLVMEGMKMELTITAARAGTVSELHCAAGDQVEADVPLVELSDDASASQTKDDTEFKA